jgi:hypothetical protein
MNLQLKIFSRLFVVGRELRPDGPLKEHHDSNLAFMTPFEETKAFEKRAKTALDWGKQYNYYTPTQRVVDNVAREGFRITDDIKRTYWGGGNVVWRVRDPAGWEVEIQSQNLMMLINTVGIDAGGRVPGQCVWARDGAVNVLLPVDTEEYRSSIQNAETYQKTRPTVKGKKIVGAKYKLLNGEEVVYLGKVYAARNADQYDQYFVKYTLKNLYSVHRVYQYHIRPMPDSQAFYAVLKIDKYNTVTLYKTAPTFSELVVEDAGIDLDEALDRPAEFAANDYTRILNLTREPFEHISFELQEFKDVDQLTEADFQVDNGHFKNSLQHPVFKRAGELFELILTRSKQPVLVKVLFDESKPDRIMRSQSNDIALRDSPFSYYNANLTLDLIQIPIPDSRAVSLVTGPAFPTFKEQLEYIESLGMTKAYQFKIKTQ